MNAIRKLAAVIVLVAMPIAANADTITFDYVLELGSIVPGAGGCSGCNLEPDADLLVGVPVFFPNDTFVADIGDTLVVNATFENNARILIQDIGESSTEVFRWSWFLPLGDPNVVGYNATATLTLLDARGQVVENPIQRNFGGGGGGFGAVFLEDLTDQTLVFSGFQLSYQINSAISGFPATVAAHDGLNINADRIRIVPVPEPSTLALLGIGLFGMGAARRKNSKPPLNQ